LAQSCEKDGTTKFALDRYDEGVQKASSDVTGFAIPSLRFNLHSHVLPDMQDSAFDAMEAALGTVS
jgi:hypothetical protein